MQETTPICQLYPHDGKIGIIEALAKVSKAIGAIGKDKTNTMQNFKYRSIDAVMSGIHDAIADNDIVITTYHEEKFREDRATKQGGVSYYKEKDFTFCFRHKDGSRLETISTGSAADSGDKVDNKCLSIALKYALTTTFIIPLETDDPDGHSPEATAKKKKDVITTEDKTAAGRMFSDFCKKNFADQDMKAMFAKLVSEGFEGKTLDQLTEAEGKLLVEVVKKHVEAYKPQEEAKEPEALTPIQTPVETAPVAIAQPTKEKPITASDKMVAITSYAAYCEKSNPGSDKKVMLDIFVADKFNKILEDLTEVEGKQLVEMIKTIDQAYDEQKKIHAGDAVAIAEDGTIEKAKPAEELAGEDAYIEGQALASKGIDSPSDIEEAVESLKKSESNKIDEAIDGLPF